MPPSDRTATSVVPPPMSTTIEPGGLGHRQAGADRGRHRLLDQEHAPGAGALRRLSWIARRSTAVEPEGTQMITCGLAKLRRVCTWRMKCLIISSATSKSAMTPSRKRPDRLDVAGGAADHLLGLLADGEDLLLAADGGDRHDRRLVEDDAAALDVDQRVGGAEIDRHVGGKQAEQSARTSSLDPFAASLELTGQAGGARSSRAAGIRRWRRRANRPGRRGRMRSSRQAPRAHVFSRLVSSLLSAAT